MRLPSPSVNISMSRDWPRLRPDSGIAPISGLSGSVKSTTCTSEPQPEATSAYARPPSSNALTSYGDRSEALPSSSRTMDTTLGGTSRDFDGGAAVGPLTLSEAECADGLPRPSTARAVTVLGPRASSTWTNQSPEE